MLWERSRIVMDDGGGVDDFTFAAAQPPPRLLSAGGGGGCMGPPLMYPIFGRPRSPPRAAPAPAEPETATARVPLGRLLLVDRDRSPPPAPADDVDDDDGYFFRFQSLPASLPQRQADHHEAAGSKTTADQDGGGGGGGVSESTTLVQQGDGGGRADKSGDQGKMSGRRKRPRTVKTSEEVESQRMTHIAVERNRRRQMNEYLRILRSLMPGSYVQRVRSLRSCR